MDIHHNTRCILRTVTLAGAVFVFVVIFFEVLFHNALNRRVDRGINIVAVYSSLRRPLQIIVPVYISILSAVYAAQNIVVILFQSVLSFVVRSGESDHVRRQGTIGIDSLVFFLEPDALDLAVLQCCRLKTADLIIGQPSERDIPGRIRMTDHILSHCRHIQIREICGQRLHRRFQISLTA